jgi:hypothetical protein
MAYGEVGSHYFIEGIMDAVIYEDILKQHMLPSAQELLRRKNIFQHVCDLNHTAKKVKAFAKIRVKVHEWPP